MKTNNIFDRLNPKHEIPVSLFPCSSMHRTSMKIGRATPMYSINMFAGNRIELSVEQLTRFSTLNHPVMNNYEVNYGFYFVPWTAHDEMGTSAWFRKTILGSTSYSSHYAGFMKDYKLNANEFFNPAFDNSLRHHPLMVKFRNLGNIKLVGSLYDHLGYYIGATVDTSSTNFYTYAYNASSGSGTAVNIYDMYGASAPTAYTMSFNVTKNITKNKLASSASTYTAGSTAILPIDIWAYEVYLSRSGYEYSSFSDYQTRFNTLGTTQEWFKDCIMLIQNRVLNMPIPTDYILSTTWEELFGNLLPAQMLDLYSEYLSSIAVQATEGDVELNCLDWLNYMRIYSDWFLNDHYTRRDDFLDMIGEAYYRACGKTSAQASWTVPQLFTAGTQLNPSASVPCNIKCGANQNPELAFFAEYIRRGECMPVLWELNRMTAQRCEVDIKGLLDGNSDVSSSLSVADTAVGSTIREHFFNRAVQKFKDIVSRAGYDFRKNTRAIYGAGPKDEILNRSQLITVKQFPVNIGDCQQTADTSKGNVGDFAGFGFSKNGTDTVSWTAQQNGTFMVIAWVRPRNVAYADGVDREKMKSDYLDYLLPAFGGVGYQDVYAREVYCRGSVGATTAIGKEEIYSEYMSKPNYCTGSMRTYNKTWHSDRFFNSAPTLSKSSSPKFLYITDDDDVNRIFNNVIDDPILCTAYFKGNITRQLPSRILTNF